MLAVLDSLRASKLASPVFIVSATDDASVREAGTLCARWLEADWEPGHGDFSRKIRLGYENTSEEFVFQAADDVEFTSGWDEAVLRVADETGAGVVGTNDAANPLCKKGLHSTHTLIRRSYIEDPGASWDGPGTVFSEAYDHQYVDNELVELAKRRDQWAFAHDALVKHRHWVFDRTVRKDATYLKGSRSHRQDLALFMQRRKQWARSS